MPELRAHARARLRPVRPLVVDSLEVCHGRVTAVTQLSFAVEPGRIHGVLGPNGCGKTSTLRAVVGLLRPQAGSIAVNGVEQPAISARAQVAYVPDEPDGLGELCPTELFALVRALYRADAGYEARAHTLVHAFDFAACLRTRLDALSHGRRRVASMIAAFALARPLVVVDEATAALDPEAVVVLRDVLRVMARRGAGVVVAAQDLGFAERICDGVVLLSSGRSVAAGTVAEICGGLPLEQAFLRAVGSQARIQEARRELVAL
jgi:ABC-2 type transport system ATP-binding protein